MSKPDETPAVPYSMIGKLTRRYSWSFVIAMVVIAVLLLLAGVAAILFGYPEYKEKLFDIAQYIGGAGTVLGSLKAYWKEIRQKYALIRLQHASRHAVVCGLGGKGMRLVNALLSKGMKVVAIESRKDHPDINGCWERGVVVITGDASDKAILDEANAGLARFLFALTGDDNTNIEIARSGDELAEATALNSGEHVFVKCFSHVSSGSIRDIFSHHNLFATTHDAFDASMFSVYDAASRFVLEKYPPDALAAIHGNQSGAVRILVLGCTMMGESIIKHTARIAHYLDRPQVEIIAVDKGAKAVGERFFGAFGDGAVPPSFIVPGITVRFVDRDPDTLCSLRELTGEADALPTVVYIALGQDSQAVSLSLRVRGMLGREDIPVVICMKSEMSKLMEGQEFPFTTARSIYAFNILDFACAFPVLMDEVTDEMARSIHSAYVISLINFCQDDFKTSKPSELLEKILSEFPSLSVSGGSSIDKLNDLITKPDLYDMLQRKLPSQLPAYLSRLLNDVGNLRQHPYTDMTIPQQELLMRFNSGLLALTWPGLCPDKVSENPSLTGWRELTEDKKDANRWQADHLSVKLRAIGYTEGDMAALEKASGNPRLLEALSEMEHRRWNAAMLMDGWRYEAGKKDPLRKTHPSIIPYDDLSDAEKAKDDTMIHNIRNLVSSSGWKRYLEYINAV